MLTIFHRIRDTNPIYPTPRLTLLLAKDRDVYPGGGLWMGVDLTLVDSLVVRSHVPHLQEPVWAAGGVAHLWGCRGGTTWSRVYGRTTPESWCRLIKGILSETHL